MCSRGGEEGCTSSRIRGGHRGCASSGSRVGDTKAIITFVRGGLHNYRNNK